MIEFRQCSLRLFRFCDWSSLFSDNSPCASFWTTQNFIPNGVGTSAMKFVQSGQRRQNASDFGVWREGCSFPTAFDHNWNQYKTDRNLGTKSQRGGNWQQCCGGISFELGVFAQESNFLGLEFVCLFFVSQKCRHWILVEDYGMHVYIYIIYNYILHTYLYVYLYGNIERNTHCVFSFAYRLLRMSNTYVQCILFESCCLQFGIGNARQTNGSNGCNMPRCIQSCLR